MNERNLQKKKYSVNAIHQQEKGKPFLSHPRRSSICNILFCHRIAKVIQVAAVLTGSQEHTQNSRTGSGSRAVRHPSPPLGNVLFLSSFLGSRHDQQRHSAKAQPTWSLAPGHRPRGLRSGEEPRHDNRSSKRASRTTALLSL